LHAATNIEYNRCGRILSHGAAPGNEVTMIRGMHAMFYSSEASALRTFLKDKLGLTGVDIGEGWIIFEAPEADLGVHPTESGGPPSGTADVSFYCDDIAQTVGELQRNGVEFTQGIEDHGYGLVTYFKVPGGFRLQLYQPRYGK
jgi:catechol 2,3-dioxygenase-like lactoylglutathione lyase family enzyme